jgi:Mn-dependent DtxR family transcriptional regulator
MSYINVQVNTRDLDSEDLIEIVEERGYRVTAPGQIDKDVEALHTTLDEIHNLYLSFCVWKDGDKNERFEHELKKFFLETIDMKVL